MSGLLPVDPDELAACVNCGLCLADCPTFRVTGEEALSPRGRIAAMRAVDAGAAPAGPRYAEAMTTCVGCRACESACPSAVPFGRLMEGARRGLRVPWWQRSAYRAVGRPRLLFALTALGALAQRAHLVPRRLGSRMSLPALPLRRRRLEATGADVWLFTGCVMDAWQRPVHQASIDVLSAMGFGVALPGPGAGCCGALARHAGLHDDAVRSARRTIAAFPGDAPILVDSAGCGAALREYGRLLDPGGAGEGERFARRVFDIQEWIAAHLDRLPPPAPSADGARPLVVAVQDPCHLRHAQRAEAHVRTVLAPYVELVELGDGGCCGAGGAYSLLQPSLARAIRDQKVTTIEAVAADVVASANPGCALWLAAGGVATLHPMEIVARALG